MLGVLLGAVVCVRPLQYLQAHVSLDTLRAKETLLPTLVSAVPSIPIQLCSHSPRSPLQAQVWCMPIPAWLFASRLKLSSEWVDMGHTSLAWC